jgi:TPR repeat protein
MEKAFALYRKAVLASSADNQCNVAALHAVGRGTRADLAGNSI